MSQLHDSNGRTHNTFALLWCQRCERASEPPARPTLPDFVADPYLECSGCGEKLALLQCAVMGEQYQERLGAVHQHVATLGSLPDRHGSWR